MYLRDRPLLNALRRLRGWRAGDVRVMVEARKGSDHVFFVFECRGKDPAEIESLVSEELAGSGFAFVEIAQDLPASVPMPRRRRIIRLSDAIPMAAADVTLAPVPRKVDTR